MGVNRLRKTKVLVLDAYFSRMLRMVVVKTKGLGQKQVSVSAQLVTIYFA